eukprot:555880-Pyramimonas_sp.AAC.1
MSRAFDCSSNLSGGERAARQHHGGQEQHGCGGGEPEDLALGLAALQQGADYIERRMRETRDDRGLRGS